MIDEPATDLIEITKEKYGVIPGSIQDRSIDDMLTREPADVVHEKIIEYYEGDGSENFDKTMKSAHEMMEDHKNLPPEEFRKKWNWCI